MKTSVVHCMRHSYDVYIGRGKDPITGELSIWGNPFSHIESRIPGVIRVATRHDAIECYRDWLEFQPELLAQLSSLKGKVLGCWCKPADCHGDVLAELAEKC